MANILDALVSPSGRVVAVARTSSIVVSDRVADLARMEDLISALDVPAREDARRLTEPPQAANRDVMELRRQMQDLHEQMQQMQKFLEQMAERSEGGGTAEPAEGVQELKVY